MSGSSGPRDPNARRAALAAPLLAEAGANPAASADPAAAIVHLVGEARDQPGGWEGDRHLVGNAEDRPQGPHTRFVVTTRADPPLTPDDR